MTTTDELWDFLNQWRQVTVSEGQAIARGQWKQVAACQARKKEWMQQYALLEAPKTLPPEIRSLIQEILALEQRNYDSLAAGISLAHEQLEALGQSRQNLRQLRRAYTASRPAVWQSYS